MVFQHACSTHTSSYRRYLDRSLREWVADPRLHAFG